MFSLNTTVTDTDFFAAAVTSAMKTMRHFLLVGTKGSQQLLAMNSKDAQDEQLCFL